MLLKSHRRSPLFFALILFVLFWGNATHLGDLYAQPGGRDLVRVWTNSEPIAPRSTVDPRSGLLSLSVTDLVVPAGPISLEVGRSLIGYTAGYDAWIGNRWRLNWEVTLSHAEQLATISEFAGETLFTFQQEDNQYVSASGDRIWFNNKQAICTRKDGSALQFDAQGRLIGRVDRNGNRIKISYDPDQHVSRVEGPHGSFLKFTTDVHGRLAAVEGSNGAIVRYFYGIDSTETTPAGTVAYEYGTDGSLTLLRHPLNGTTEFVYGPKKRVREVRSNSLLAERFEYDEASRKLRYTDAQGEVTTTLWSPDGKREEVTGPQGEKSMIERNAEGRISQITGPTGKSVQYRYDPSGENDRHRGCRRQNDPTGVPGKFRARLSPHR